MNWIPDKPINQNGSLPEYTELIVQNNYTKEIVFTNYISAKAAYISNISCVAVWRIKWKQ